MINIKLKKVIFIRYINLSIKILKEQLNVLAQISIWWGVLNSKFWLAVKIYK